MIIYGPDRVGSDNSVAQNRARTTFVSSHLRRWSTSSTTSGRCSHFHHDEGRSRRCIRSGVARSSVKAEHPRRASQGSAIAQTSCAQAPRRPRPGSAGATWHFARRARWSRELSLLRRRSRWSGRSWTQFEVLVDLFSRAQRLACCWRLTSAEQCRGLRSRLSVL